MTAKLSNDAEFDVAQKGLGKMIYVFFLIHMLAFGAAGFLMAYAPDRPDLGFLYAHGGFAIFVYLIFYLVFFGVDEVKWMFINAGLGVMAIYTQIEWILSLFGARIADYPWEVHVVPFLYFVLYTFLLRRMVLDLTGALSHPERRQFVDTAYVLIYAGVMIGSWLGRA